ncbi:MAG: nitronate monooxygenase [Gemmatimonadaceae bacterium]|nr:nitronate monooxygenase [Gemmatimonadaceae bacterium]MCW5827456.1 nitronate monooxygenase [Gemmatimonadaceae bacterium]
MTDTAFTRHTGVRVPLICGPMYPCSNPELVAAVSEAGGLGVVQPISLTYVHGYDFRAGLRHIRSLTSRPIGFNALIEGNNKLYRERMTQWIDIALEEGVRFFLTSLGNPKWVCERVHAAGGVVYHDVTERKWAQKGVDGGVDGLIAVNNLAGGHAGRLSPEALLDELAPFGLPVVSAGGVGDAAEFARHLTLGYAAVQLGTRFIATTECKASDAYKQAILDATADDIVLTERLTGVPVAVIRNAYIDRLGTSAGWFARWMLRGRRRKHWMRTWYALSSVRRLKRSLMTDDVRREYWQAGRSVSGIHEVKPAGEIVREFAAALD